MFCMRLSDTFLQLAKGKLISLWAVAKGYLLSFGSLCMQNPRIACNAYLVFNVLQYTALQISLELCIPKKELAKIRSQI
jgi:hypothetical protein